MSPQIPVIWPDMTKAALSYIRTAYAAAYPADSVTFARSRPETTSGSKVVALSVVPQSRVTLISRDYQIVAEAMVVDADGVDAVDDSVELAARVMALFVAWPIGDNDIVTVTDGAGPTIARETDSQRELAEFSLGLVIQAPTTT